MNKLKLLSLLALVAPSTAATELKIDVYEGPTECSDEDKVQSGDHLEMHYTGTIDESSETGEKGKKFDSSRDRSQTFDFQIGQGRVIKGWDEGLLGLCVGAKATLVIPPDMGYGASGAGADIPGGATLNFDVEVVAKSDGPPPPPNYFAMIDSNKDGFLDREEIEAYFKQMGAEVPDALWEHEDKDKDGKISWDEFSGPKGNEPPIKEEFYLESSSIEMGCTSSRNQTINENERRNNAAQNVNPILDDQVRGSNRNNSVENSRRPRSIGHGLRRRLLAQHAQEEEVARLQADIFALELIFQNILGRSFAEELARNLAEVTNDDPDHCPPAATESIENLTCIEVEKEDLYDERNKECCICFHEQNIGDRVVRLPCGHLYHRPCIEEWLKKKCTCPICRYELKTDNDRFEEERLERMQARKTILRTHDLRRIPIIELQELSANYDVNDREQLIALLRNSERVDIVDSSTVVHANM